MSAASLEQNAADATIPPILARAAAMGAISSLDVQFAARLAALYEEAEPGVVWALALASRQLGQGHVCADLARLCEEGLPIEVGGAPETLPVLISHDTLDAWLAALRMSSLVDADAGSVDADDGSVDPASPRPLVLDQGGRLYLARAHRAERALADALLDRARSLLERTDAAPADVDLASAIRRLVPGDGPGDTAARDALQAGASRRLAIVTGGPGTGKTTTVARLIALVAERAHAQGRPMPVVRLLAPTGKAAAAMANAFARGRTSLELPEAVAAALPTGAETIQRALHPQTRLDAFGRPTPLALDADIVVVDEASMVDLALMQRLFEACRDVPRLVLLGDPDQLASVEAGAVLGDLCALEDSTSPLVDARVHLTYSHRFTSTGGIGLLADAIRAGDADRVLALFEDAAHPEIERIAADASDRVAARLAEETRRLQERIAAAEGAAARLERTLDHRILCAHRRGALGAETLARRLEDVAARARRTRARSGWFTGRMLLVTRNAPEQDLWNGDVGLVDDSDGELRAYFPDGRGGVRALGAGRLPAHESAMAMTVHKSQGSEFDAVDLVLGDVASPIMTRELFYTGVTRARQALRVYASESALRAMIGRRISRDSALRERLCDDRAVTT